MTMTADAKRELAKTIRALRDDLLTALHDATQSAYLLDATLEEANLEADALAKRARLEAWIAEQQRASHDGPKNKRGEIDFRREAEKQAAYTLLNRLIMLRLMEEPPAHGGEPLRAPAVVTGGWESRAYRDLRQLAPALVHGDKSEGYALLLQLVFEDLAHELPGLYGHAGVAELVPIPVEALRGVVEALNAPALDACWSDDMTLGWVYQYWNDPDREALDAKINSGGKIEGHEIASKTQLFTERYMVDWLLQNTINPLWLALCHAHGWTPEVVSDGTLDALEARRIDWRAKRDAGQVALTDLMPLHTDAERRWAYYVPQPLPQTTTSDAPTSLRDVRLIDPAMGSGHFLVGALELLVALYREEARHRGAQAEEQWQDAAIVARVLSHNLHGVDLDPRAIQIAAASLWLKARQLAPRVEPTQMNLVAANLRLGSLPDDDPALEELRLEVERAIGIPASLTDTIIHAMRGADHLGSLLKIDATVEAALTTHEHALGTAIPEQGHLFQGFAAKQNRQQLDRATARATLLDRLEAFLQAHTRGDDLGLRLRGQQLAAGVRFIRMMREGSYDLVVANPPYQGTSKMADSAYIDKHYTLGKADLYAAFMLRGLELVREGGFSAMLAMRNWMFIKQYSSLREHFLERYDLRALGDFDRGAFEDIPDEVVSVCVSVFSRTPQQSSSIALCPTPREDNARDNERTPRKRAATLCQVGRHSFDPTSLKVVPEWPLVYWWSNSSLENFSKHPALGAHALITPGIKTGLDFRFLRYWHETYRNSLPKNLKSKDLGSQWQFYIKGAAGSEWFEPARHILEWRKRGLQLKIYGTYCAPGTVRLRNPELYCIPSVMFSPNGASFSARTQIIPSLFGDKAPSLFEIDIPNTLCLLNSKIARKTLQDLNPTIDFKIVDVERLPIRQIAQSDEIFSNLKFAFETTENHLESSPMFQAPGPSSWRYAQAWAQEAVDRAEGAPLPAYEEERDEAAASDHVSFALGVALGRFGRGDSAGILDPTTDNLDHALPYGVLCLDTTLDDADLRDGLGEAACAPLREAWEVFGASVDAKRGLRGWLASEYFKLHKSMYENRPIHWPLSSKKKTFVVWITIHRMNEQTLRVVLADHLYPTLTRLQGQLNDLRLVRDGEDKRAAKAAERDYAKTQAAIEELQAFMEDITQCADRGAPPTDAKCPPRAQDARYAPVLDDGVMINSAALWPLLEPQWKEPKKWWKELCESKGRKDYDWSHLAMRYWPHRVDAKCKVDPSLGVAHGCFWRYHPERAWAWELRLQDEISPDFRIEEAPYQPAGLNLDTPDAGDAPHRTAWLRDHAPQAIDAIEREATRRMGRGANKRLIDTFTLLESGLWRDHAEAIWSLELRLATRQGADLHLLAPDEPDARAALLEEKPELTAQRQDLLATLVPDADLFDELDEEVDGMDVGADDMDGEDC